MAERLIRSRHLCKSLDGTLLEKALVLNMIYAQNHHNEQASPLCNHADWIISMYIYLEPPALLEASGSDKASEDFLYPSPQDPMTKEPIKKS
jgi:hypothetical protein